MHWAHTVYRTHATDQDLHTQTSATLPCTADWHCPSSERNSSVIATWGSDDKYDSSTFFQSWIRPSQAPRDSWELTVGCHGATVSQILEQYNSTPELVAVVTVPWDSPGVPGKFLGLTASFVCSFVRGVVWSDRMVNCEGRSKTLWVHLGVFPPSVTLGYRSVRCQVLCGLWWQSHQTVKFDSE